jgi:hypothetical protein
LPPFRHTLIFRLMTLLMLIRHISLLIAIDPCHYFHYADDFRCH